MTPLSNTPRLEIPLSRRAASCESGGNDMISFCNSDVDKGHNGFSAVLWVACHPT